MSYVDAGYAICLGVLALYGVGLVLRRRRLERAAAVLDAPGGDRVPAGTDGEPGCATVPGATTPRVPTRPTTAPRAVAHPVGEGER